jgi:hypothetical protein
MKKPQIPAGPTETAIEKTIEISLKTIEKH